MSKKKVEAKSQLQLLGEVEANWTIGGFNGPLAHFVRPRAECIVNIPTADDAVSDIQLRFHLKPLDPQQKSSDTGLLGSNTCSLGKYSLLVDVLNGPRKNLAMLISLNSSNNSSATQQAIIPEPGSQLRNILLLKENCPSGTVGNGLSLEDQNATDKQFLLQVSAYKMESTGPDLPKRVEFCKDVNIQEQLLSKIKLGENETPNVILEARAGMFIHAHKRILCESSEFFRQYLNKDKDDLEELFVPVCGEPFLILLHWMYTGEFAAAEIKKKHLGRLCAVAKELAMDTIFWKSLEENLDKLYCPGDMMAFTRTLSTFGLTPPPELWEKVNYVEKSTPRTNGDWKLEFERKWELVDGLLANVSYLTVEFVNPIRRFRCKPKETFAPQPAYILAEPEPKQPLIAVPPLDSFINWDKIYHPSEIPNYVKATGPTSLTETPDVAQQSVSLPDEQGPLYGIKDITPQSEASILPQISDDQKDSLIADSDIPTVIDDIIQQADIKLSFKKTDDQKDLFISESDPLSTTEHITPQPELELSFKVAVDQKDLLTSDSEGDSGRSLSSVCEFVKVENLKEESQEETESDAKTEKKEDIKNQIENPEEMKSPTSAENQEEEEILQSNWTKFLESFVNLKSSK